MVMHVHKHTVQINDVNHEPHKDRGDFAASLALTTDSLSWHIQQLLAAANG